MAYRLKDRLRQIPNGMLYYEPRTKWRSRPWAGFNQIVDEVIGHRNANPWLNASTDRPTVEAEVDQFNANLCAQMGWGDYIVTVEGGAVPSAPFPVRRAPSPASPLQNVAAGSEAVLELIRSKEEAVKPELAEARAEVCSRCPQNGKGGLERFFTVPLANAIRKGFEVFRGWDLKTSRDDKLGVCEACNCPMKLKVHFPIGIIRNNLEDSAKAALWEQCWIRNEP